MMKLSELLLLIALFFASAHSDSIPWTCNRDETFELQNGVALYLAYWVTGEDDSFTLHCEGFKIWCSTDSIYCKEESFELSDPNKWNVITIKLSLGLLSSLSMDPFGTFDVLNTGGIKNEKIRITSEKKISWQKCDSYNSCDLSPPVPEPQKCPSLEPDPQSQKCPTVPADITLVLLIMCCLLILIIIGLVVYIIRGKKAMPEAPEANMRQGTNMRQVDNVTLNSLYGNLDFLNAEMAADASSTQPGPPKAPAVPKAVY